MVLALRLTYLHSEWWAKPLNWQYDIPTQMGYEQSDAPYQSDLRMPYSGETVNQAEAN